MSDSPVRVDQPRGAPPVSLENKDLGLPVVLLVDDQPARLLSYEAILAELPVRCVRALSGEQALAQLLRAQFAVIVLDVCMPVMDGFETARLIRSHHRFQKTPILFVTGVHLTELDHLKGYEVGAIDYLSVPVVPEILRSKIAILVELYQRRSELEELTHALVSAREHLRTPQQMQAADPAATPGKGADSAGGDAEASEGEFLRTLSHELRNALAPICNVSELLLRETATTNPMHPILSLVRQHSLRIACLADAVDARLANTN